MNYFFILAISSTNTNNSSVTSCLSIVSTMWNFCTKQYWMPLYGIVRDQVGQTVNAEGAEIILLKNGLEIERAPVLSGALLDQNYELRIRVDQFQAGTSL